MGRPKTYHISLTEEEVRKLKSIIRKKNTSRTMKCRCQILLALDEAHGKVYSNEQCALSIGVSKGMVHNVIGYYQEGGMERVLTVKRSVNSDNARRKLDGRGEARLIEIACGPVPQGKARWTLRLLADKSKVELEVPVSKDTIGKALKKTNFSLTKSSTGANRPKRTPRS